MSDNISFFSKESIRISREQLDSSHQIAVKIDEAINQVNRLFSEFLDKQYGVLDPQDKTAVPPQRVQDYYTMCKLTAMLLMGRALPIFKEIRRFKEIEDFSKGLREISSMMSEFGEDELEEVSRGFLSTLEDDLEDE